MRPHALVLATLTASLSLGPPASAAGTTSVAIGDAARTGSIVSVTGTSTYADQPFVVQGTDPAGDTLLPRALGQDLTAASIATNANGTISFRWSAAELPPALNGLPQVTYGWTFCIGPPDDEGEGPRECWELTASRMNWFIPNPNPWLQVWDCPSTCDGNSLTTITGPLVFDGATQTITATLSLAALGAEAGQEITPLIGFSFHDGALWTGMAGWYLAEEDFVSYEDAYRIPGRQVSLAIATPGQDPASVEYGVQASVATNGSFTGAVDISQLAPGGYTLYARACLGENNCAYTTRDITI